MPIKILDRVRSKDGPRPRFEGWVDGFRRWSDAPKTVNVVDDNGSVVYFPEVTLNKIAMPVNLHNYPNAENQLLKIKNRLSKEPLNHKM